MKSHGYKKFIYARSADVVSLIHVCVVVVAAFGWWLMPHNPLHVLVLLLTLASWLFTGSCILARVELFLRRQYLNKIPDYQHGYLHYHLHRLTDHAPSLSFVRLWGYVYLSLAVLLWIARFYVETAMLV